MPLSPTEADNPASRDIDTKSAAEVVGVIHNEDRRAWEAVGDALAKVAEVVDRVVDAWRRGGRLIYVGAGTSGRLGVLDASECPPTFGVSSELVVGVMAGGDAALRSSVEGAEDDGAAGADALARLAVTDADVVCGIAASGTTPFVLAALAEARARGAPTTLITSNPIAAAEVGDGVDHTVLLAVGPEVIAGSSRMKAGTATKMVLNMLTTAAMIRWGKVYDNLMVDLQAASRKLRGRAVRLVCRIAAVDADTARRLLEASNWHVKCAIVMHKAGVDCRAAGDLLAQHKGSLRGALEAAE